MNNTPSRRDAIRLLTASGIAFALSGCGGSSTSIGGLQTPTGRFGDLSFTSSTDKSVYASGETVTITFTIQNVGATTQVLTGSAPDADTRVRRASDGAILWQWSVGKLFPAALDQTRLGPGESRTLTFTWDQKDQQGNLVPTGSYVIEAWSYQAPGLTPTDRDNLSILLGAPLLHITIR